MSEEAKGITFTISGVKERIAIYGFAILIGGTTIADIIVPKRPDPFTGTEGAIHDDRLDFIELEISQCKERNSKHREQQSGILAELRSEVKNNRFLIERCMDITNR